MGLTFERATSRSLQILPISDQSRSDLANAIVAESRSIYTTYVMSDALERTDG
jgi:hypothetical protein